ncbi:MAG: glucosidase, partial [Terriglobales bacterium]
LEWFIDNRPDLTENVACMRSEGRGERRLLSIATTERLRSILNFMLDEREFLSPYGIRSVSQFHRGNPYKLEVHDMEHRVDYEPGESSTGVFGGNSNWRGPIWFPLNYLLVESLQKFHYYLGDEFKVEFPTGSGKMMTLWEVSGELSRRMTSIFLRDEQGRRPVFGNLEKFQTDQHWRDLVLFHEYFHGDSGAGLGASHQTGWTGVVTKLMQQSGESRKKRKPESTESEVLAALIS